jgi:hypothetical protein
MIESLFAFLGGSVFRGVWGEISSYFSKSQEHTHELERMKIQADVDSAYHSRSMDMIRLQAELGVKTIQVQAESAISQIESEAWLSAVKSTTQSVGIFFIDAWNGVIRPLVATWAIVVISIDMASKQWVLDDNGWMLASAALGIYLADRALFKRGK